MFPAKNNISGRENFRCLLFFSPLMYLDYFSHLKMCFIWTKNQLQETKLIFKISFLIMDSPLGLFILSQVLCQCSIHMQSKAYPTIRVIQETVHLRSQVVRLWRILDYMLIKVFDIEDIPWIIDTAILIPKIGT